MIYGMQRGVQRISHYYIPTCSRRSTKSKCGRAEGDRECPLVAADPVAGFDGLIGVCGDDDDEDAADNPCESNPLDWLVMTVGGNLQWESVSLSLLDAQVSLVDVEGTGVADLARVDGEGGGDCNG